MKILLLNIDSVLPNIALLKLAKWYEGRGDTVIWDNAMLIPFCDKVYASCIFTKNRAKVENLKSLYPQIEVGGTGWNLTTNLPEEVDKIKLHINYGFTTRGCIRHCPFCFVPEKEGAIRVVGDVYDIWDGESKTVVLMDNNILALPEHFDKIYQQLKQENLTVDFNQGLDHRLLTIDIWKKLHNLKHVHEVRFAYDDIAYTPSVTKALDLMIANGLRNWGTRWYVYVGEKDTFDTVYQRLQLLQFYKQRAYLMRDEKVYDNPCFVALAQWCNTAGAFTVDLPSLLVRNEKMRYYAKYFPVDLSDKSKIREVKYQGSFPM